MASLLLINGPNLNLLGSREPGVYGDTSLAEVESRLTDLAAELGHSLQCFQSNAEHEIVDASLMLARQGLYVEPTSAHAAAAFSKLIQNETIGESDETVVILTGPGLKTTPFYEAKLTKN